MDGFLAYFQKNNEAIGFCKYDRWLHYSPPVMVHLITAPFTDALHRVGISIALMIANPNPQQLGGYKDPSLLYIA
jgi:hypothetical protein